MSKLQWRKFLLLGCGFFCVLVLIAVIALIATRPRMHAAAQLPTLKSIYVTLFDYQKEFGKLPDEHGEFRRCSFVAPEFRNAPELCNWYYTGLNNNPYPMVLRKLESHWFYQKILRQDQRTWAMFSDGHSETFTFPPDAVGFSPWEAALAGKLSYTPEQWAELHSRLQKLPNGKID